VSGPSTYLANPPAKKINHLFIIEAEATFSNPISTLVDIGSE